MVLFINVCVGQRVEVKYEGRICKGTVRYKGGVGNWPGEWVGIELDAPVGNHNGRMHGRRYFSCPDRHGIFADANDVRFIKLKRCLFNRYKSVQTDPRFQCDERLFTNTGKRAEEADEFYKKKEGGFLDTRERPRSQADDFRISHKVSSMIAPATKRRPFSARLPYKWDSNPLESSWHGPKEEPEFIGTPTIPKTHMPHSMQLYLTKKGWGDHRLIRESSVATFRDNFRRKHWNSVSF